MSLKILKNQSGGIWGPVSSPPRDYIESWIDGAGDYNFNRPADYFAAGNTSPGSKLVEIFSGSQATPPSFFGMHLGDIRWSGLGAGKNNPMKAAIVRMQDATYGGTGNFTHRTRWSAVNPSAGNYIWSDIDPIVDYILSQGQEVIFCLIATPTWASARPAESAAYEVGSAAEPSNFSYMTDYLAAVVSRYAGRIKYYEILNEVNVAGFWSGTHAVLAQYMRLAYQTVKSNDPSAKVISPSVVGLSVGAAATYFNNFMSASDGAGGFGRDWCDIVSCHLYGGTSVATSTTALAMIQSIQTAVATQGLTGKPLWNTETGLAAPALSTLPQDSMKYIKPAVAIASAMGLAHWSFYQFGPGVMGPNAGQVAEWNEWRDILLSGPITQINYVAPISKFAITVNGKNYLI